MSDDLVTWLREQIGADLARALMKLRRSRMSKQFRLELRELVARCEAELAILDLYEQQSAKAGENAMEEDRAWTLAKAVYLLASGYKHRPGYRKEWKP